MKGFSVSPASVVYHAKASTSSHYINYPPIDSRQRPETGILNSLGLLLKQTVVYSSNLTDTYRNCINTCIGMGGWIRDFVTQRTKKKEAFFCLHMHSHQRPETGILNSLGLLLKQTVVYSSNLTDTYRNCINTCIGMGGWIRDFVTQRTKKKEAFFCLHILSRQRLETGSKSLGPLLKHIMHGLHFKQTMYRKCTNICIGLD